MSLNIKKQTTDFPYAIKSFLGYLEGTHKSVHTIKNYRLDLLDFQKFILKVYTQNPVRLDQVTRKDLERYRDHLNQSGQKSNTRRRKGLTVSLFLNYLAKRNRLGSEMAQKMVVPHKVERIPFIVPVDRLLEVIQKLPQATLLEARNKALLWTLAETGCLVSEVCKLRFEQWEQEGVSGGFLAFSGKSVRKVPISIELFQSVEELRKNSQGSPWLFLGFNKFGSLGGPITPRGIEMLVKLYAPRLGYSELTPRTFRHSVTVSWLKKGIPQKEVQAWLGLKSAYAFRAYEQSI